MNKDPTCTTLAKGAIKYMNNWTCRNCFRIHAHYKFGQYGINNWEDKDYIDIFFRYKVLWLNHSHPIDRVEQIGDKGNQWRIYFKPGKLSILTKRVPVKEIFFFFQKKAKKNLLHMPSLTGSGRVL